MALDTLWHLAGGFLRRHHTGAWTPSDHRREYTICAGLQHPADIEQFEMGE